MVAFERSAAVDAHGAPGGSDCGVSGRLCEPLPIQPRVQPGVWRAAVTRYHVLASHGWISNPNGICVPLPRPHASTGGHPLLTAIAAAPARRGSHRKAPCRFVRPGQTAEERFGVRLQGAPGARAYPSIPRSFAAVPPRILIRSSSLSPGIAMTWSTGAVFHGNG